MKQLLFSSLPGALFYRAVTCQQIWRDLAKEMVTFVPDPGRPLRVLDLGCGAGVSTFALASALGEQSTVTGLDLSEVLIHAAQRAHDSTFHHLGNVAFEQGDAYDLPYEDGRFDLVTGHSFLYLVDDPCRVLAEVRRVLAPTGRLVLMEPATEGSLIAAARSIRQPVQALIAAPFTALRFLFALVHWRMLAAAVGTMSPEIARHWFAEAGYGRVQFHPTLRGLAWHVAADPS